MNLGIIKSLAGLMRVFWKTDYREMVESLKIPMKKDEGIDDFLKRLNSMNDERSILIILNNMLLDHSFQNHCEKGGPIENRLAVDVRFDLLQMIRNDGYIIEKNQVVLPPFSTSKQFEKTVETLFKKLDYDILKEKQKGTMRADFVISRKNNPLEKTIVEVKNYKNSLIPISAIEQLKNYVDNFGASKGILVTSSDFTPDAKKMVADSPQIEILTLNELLERIPESDHESYFDNIKEIGLTGKSTAELEEEQAISGIKEKKQKLLEKYQNALSSDDPNEKGTLLEDVMAEIFSLVENLTVWDKKHRTPTEEIDIQLRNHNNQKVWADFDSVVFVECKNWSNPVGASAIRDFVGKMDNNGITAGILVAIHGITGTEYRDAKNQIRNFLRDKKKIVVLNGEDILEILNCTDVTDKVEDKYKDLFN